MENTSLIYHRRKLALYSKFRTNLWWFRVQNKYPSLFLRNYAKINHNYIVLVLPKGG